VLKKSLIAAALLLFATAPLFAAKKAVRPSGAEASKNWSHGILAGDTLYVSGMAGEDKAGKIPATFEGECKLAFDNIDAVLKTAGMSSDNVVAVQVYLTDVALFSRMNTCYTSYFKPPMPTRTTVIVSRLVGDGHVEITVTARK
jgi:2-iminobutanoate/2-iminopropanoate deaminase